MSAVLLLASGEPLRLASGGSLLLARQPASRVTSVEAVDINGDFVDLVTRYSRLSWTYELGQDGAGSITVDGLDTVTRDTLRAATLLRFNVEGIVRAGLVLRSESLDGAEQPELTISGPGPKGLLGRGYTRVDPPTGVGPLATGHTTRRLDWTERRADATRLDGTVSDQGSVGDPAEFADLSQRWVWVGTATDCYLSLDFTTAADQRVVLEASSVCDEADLFLDGLELLSLRGDKGTETMAADAVTLPAGDHRLAIRGRNTEGTAGVLASLMGANADATANPDDTIVNTASSGWRGVGDPSEPPGMTPGEIIGLLLDEAHDRGTALSVTTDTTDTEQSPAGSGVSWPRTYQLICQIGDPVSKVLDQLIEVGPDIWVTGDPMVQAVSRKGSDRSAEVHVRLGRDVTADGLRHSATRTDGNVILAQSHSGEWSEHVHSSASDASIGRRERTLRAGSADTAAAAADQVNAAFETHAVRIVESSVEFVASSELVPHHDFELGDDVSIPGYDDPGGQMRSRVLSISGELGADTSEVSWSAELQETQ